MFPSDDNALSCFLNSTVLKKTSVEEHVLNRSTHAWWSESGTQGSRQQCLEWVSKGAVRADSEGGRNTERERRWGPHQQDMKAMEEEAVSVRKRWPQGLQWNWGSNKESKRFFQTFPGENLHILVIRLRKFPPKKLFMRYYYWQG